MLCAHVVCETAGYFTPELAVRALMSYTKDEAFFSDWYCQLSKLKRNNPDDLDELMTINEEVIMASVRNRRLHTHYPADFKNAYLTVRKYIDCLLKNVSDYK